MTQGRSTHAIRRFLSVLVVAAVPACALWPESEPEPAPAAGGGAAPPGLGQRLQQATTAEDHAALAAYFEGRAAAEESLAEDSRELRERFGKAAALPEVKEHYEHLMQSHRRNAADYRTLARVHRRAAEEAQAAEDAKGAKEEGGDE